MSQTTKAGTTAIIVPFPSRDAELPASRSKTETVIKAYKELRDLTKRVKVEIDWCAEFLKIAVRENGGPIVTPSGTAKVTITSKRVFDVQAVYKLVGLKIFLTLVSVTAKAADALITLGTISEAQLAECYSTEPGESIDVR